MGRSEEAAPRTGARQTGLEKVEQEGKRKNQGRSQSQKWSLPMLCLMMGRAGPGAERRKSPGEATEP